MTRALGRSRETPPGRYIVALANVSNRAAGNSGLVIASFAINRETLWVASASCVELSRRPSCRRPVEHAYQRLGRGGARGIQTEQG